MNKICERTHQLANLIGEKGWWRKTGILGDWRESATRTTEYQVGLVNLLVLRQ